MSIAMLCLQPYLCLGPHTAYCRPAQVVDDPGRLFTWVPSRAEIVLLIRTAGQTLIYVPGVDRVYYARPEIGLLCMETTVVAAQFFVERGQPRLLAFDLLCDAGHDQAGTAVALRHQRLQALQHLMKGPVTVQWCGERTALHAEFLMKLPHQTSGLLGLTDRPLVFCRNTEQQGPLMAEAALGRLAEDGSSEVDGRRTRRRV
jgi:hypothetical protein